MSILTDYLSEIAQAIKEKKGNNSPISAQNFAQEIRSLPTGGGSGSNPKFSYITTGSNPPTSSFGKDGDIYIVI